MDIEKRKAMRAKSPLIIQYSPKNPANEGKKWDTTQIQNISEKGVCITTRMPLNPGDIMTFMLKVPTCPLERIEIEGEVVESHPLESSYGEIIKETYLTRIKFLEYKEEHRQLIRSFVQWFLKKEGGAR